MVNFHWSAIVQNLVERYGCPSVAGSLVIDCSAHVKTIEPVNIGGLLEIVLSLCAHSH